MYISEVIKMTLEQLERGQQLQKVIKEYEQRLLYAERGNFIIRYNGGEVELDEDIYRELIIAQIHKDMVFLKERFERL